MEPEQEREERLGTLHLLRGKEQIAVKVVHAGDIATVSKLNFTSTGDTLCDKGHPLTLHPAQYPNALYRVAVMPKIAGRFCQDQPHADPPVRRRYDAFLVCTTTVTNQTILQGMGDQHLDVAIRKAEAKFQTGLTDDGAACTLS